MHDDVTAPACTPTRPRGGRLNNGETVSLLYTDGCSTQQQSVRVQCGWAWSKVDFTLPIAVL